jgi:hypothetical protein
MKLTFPNPSRSFDDGRNCVRFWGYDRTIEVSFCIDFSALTRLCPGVDPAEAGCLKAFDEGRERIHEVADEAFVQGGSGKGAYAYVLSAKDF